MAKLGCQGHPVLGSIGKLYRRLSQVPIGTLYRRWADRMACGPLTVKAAMLQQALKVACVG